MWEKEDALDCVSNRVKLEPIKGALSEGKQM